MRRSGLVIEDHALAAHDPDAIWTSRDADLFVIFPDLDLIPGRREVSRESDDGNAVSPQVRRKRR